MKAPVKAKTLLDEVYFGTPHPKPYMTSKIGRLLERASYLDLFLLGLLMIAGFTTYFALAPPSDGIPNSGGSRVIQAFYFTIVTFTSLGYGDLSPHGFGRIVACLAVVFGLVMIAILIGKVASERSQAMLYLILSSDRERRLQKFSEEIRETQLELAKGVSLQSSSEVDLASADLRVIVENTSNYVYFHAHHSNLGDYGNAPALYHLLHELLDTLQPIFGAMRCSTNLTSYQQLNSLLERIDRLFKAILVIQMTRKLDWTNSLLVSSRLRKLVPTPLSKGQSKLFRKFVQDFSNGQNKLTRQLTVDKLLKVLAVCPTGKTSTWRQGEHKKIASTLGISNSLAASCITELMRLGRLPK